jgi:hypothetical protein
MDDEPSRPARLILLSASWECFGPLLAFGGRLLRQRLRAYNMFVSEMANVTLICSDGDRQDHLLVLRALL